MALSFLIVMSPTTQASRVKTSYLESIVGEQKYKELKQGLLTTLDLKDKGIEDKHIELIVQEKLNLTQLNLYNNKITGTGVELIVRGFPSLKMVDLSANQIGDQGAQLVLSWKSNLERVNLSRNQIGDQGVELILNQDTKIISLDLSFNKMTNQSVRLILQKSPTLENLDLRSNKIDNEGVIYLLNGLQYNTKLTELGLYSCNIDYNYIRLINFKLEYNKGINSIFNKGVYANLGQINVDNFDKETMTRILKNHGSFEVVGPSVNELSEIALQTLNECKTVLNLPLESLNKVYNDGFHGFQNIQKETQDRYPNDIDKVRNQVAYHFKPYRLDSKIPEGIDGLKYYPKYYTKAMTFLYNLYDKIAKSYIESDKKTIFNEKAQTSVLTSRKYFPGPGGTGIPPHSDYGLLTLVVSNKDGLDVLEGENIKNGKWLRTSCGESNKPRFYINIGDWLLFQTGNKEFVAGVHQVPKLKEGRYSLAVFLNPPLDEERSTFTGIRVKYGKFLMSDKKDYHVNLRLD